MNKPTNKCKVVGIDLGTKYSVLSALSETGVPEVIPNRDGGLKTPSMIHFGKDSSEITVGECARNMRFTEPDSVVVSPKRDVGQSKTYFTRCHWRNEKGSVLTI